MTSPDDPDAPGSPDAAAGPDSSLLPRCDQNAEFGAPVALAAVNTTPGSEDSPFLTQDELTIYFSSTRSGGPGNWDLYFATRTSRDDAFGAPTLLGGPINTAAMERRPVVSGDGLTLYADTYISNYDLSVSTRADTSSSFGALAQVAALNVGTNDADPYLLPDHSALYFSTEGTGDGDIYRATRTGASFETPEPVVGINLGDGDLEASPVLTPDELTMFFQSARAGGVGDFDVWVTTRTSQVAAFSNPVNVTELNSTQIDVPHWISGDGCVLYMTKDVGTAGTDYDIYVAVRGS